MSQKVIYQAPVQSNPERIVHRMVQYQQRDYKDTTFNAVRLTLASGKQVFLMEEVDPPEFEEVIDFNLRTAKGHLWKITNNTGKAMPCSSHDTSCGICHGTWYRSSEGQWKQSASH